MLDKAKSKVVKKTVAIHPIMDGYVRKLWSILIDKGYGATYSISLNAMLLIAIIEVAERPRLTEKTNKTIASFLEDQETITRLKLEDYLVGLKAHSDVIPPFTRR
jgi:hypothetical protein